MKASESLFSDKRLQERTPCGFVLSAVHMVITSADCHCLETQVQHALGSSHKGRAAKSFAQFFQSFFQSNFTEGFITVSLKLFANFPILHGSESWRLKEGKSSELSVIMMLHGVSFPSSRTEGLKPIRPRSVCGNLFSIHDTVSLIAPHTNCYFMKSVSSDSFNPD